MRTELFYVYCMAYHGKAVDDVEREDLSERVEAVDAEMAALAWVEDAQDDPDGFGEGCVEVYVTKVGEYNWKKFSVSRELRASYYAEEL